MKGGIIKPGSLAVSTVQRPEVREVLEKICREQQAGFREVRREELKDVHYGFENQSFSYRRMKNLKPGLFGSWQIDNAALAVEAVLALPPKYKDVVYLHYYEGYTAVEISRILRKNVNTVYSLLTRAREMLKKTLEGGERS